MGLGTNEDDQGVHKEGERKPFSLPVMLVTWELSACTKHC